MPVSSAEEMKRRAAAVALQAVREGMRLGLGTGSTAAHFVDLLGERVREGLQVICVPSSERTRAQAASLAIPLSTLDDTPELDLTVDGADEFDSALRLIKGGGGALLREKIVAAASERMFVIADESKEVAMLGAFALPVEIDRFRRSRDAPSCGARRIRTGSFGRDRSAPRDGWSRFCHRRRPSHSGLRLRRHTATGKIGREAGRHSGSRRTRLVHRRRYGDYRRRSRRRSHAGQCKRFGLITGDKHRGV